jgi:hypothetical protein
MPSFHGLQADAKPQPPEQRHARLEPPHRVQTAPITNLCFDTDRSGLTFVMNVVYIQIIGRDERDGDPNGSDTRDTQGDFQ